MNETLTLEIGDSIMVTLYLDNTETTETVDLLALVQSAVQHEIERLEFALKVASKRLQPFEEKYGVTSEHFIAEMAAEDLVGGDDEYINWAGEYDLREALKVKLQQFRRVKYQSNGYSNLLQSN